MSDSVYVCDHYNVDAFIMAYFCIKETFLKHTKTVWTLCPDIPVKQFTNNATLALVERFESNHPALLKSMSQMLKWPSTSTDYSDFSRIVKPVIYFGISWNEIVCILAFGNFLASQCLKQNKASLIIYVVEWVAMFIENHCSDFLEKENGWQNMTNGEKKLSD